MELHDFRTKVHQLIGVNSDKQAFAFLSKEVSVQSKKRTTLTLLLNRYNACNDDKQAGIISYKKANKDKMVIKNDVLNFMQTLEQSDLGTNNSVVYKEINNPLLILTFQENVDEMKSFFLQLNFVNVTVVPYSEDNLDVEKFDLLIFDNQDLIPCRKKEELDDPSLIKEKMLVQERVSLMERMMKNNSKFLIHFGGMFYWVDDNRSRVHAANSQFSLYARTKEVIEFINTYRV